MDNSFVLHLFTGFVLLLLSFFSFRKILQSRCCIFALLPMLLALEQLSMAFLLVTLDVPKMTYLSHYFLLLFIILSQVIWPIWVPYSLQRMETTWSIQQLLRVFTFLGIAVGLLATWDIIFYEVEVQMVDNQLYFVQPTKGYFQKFGIYFWIIATLLPTFISYTPRVWVLGLVLATTYGFILFKNHHDFVILPPLFAVVFSLGTHWVLRDVKIQESTP